MKNNNKKIIAQFAGKQYHAERKRHMILIGTIALAVMTLFCVFSFAAGKIETDILREARTRGAVSNTTLERATEEQYEQIKNLSYIKDVGKCVQFGSILGARCTVIDNVAWENIKKPAFTDIHGAYPQEKMEIMLPMSILENAGISEPQVGMKLSASIDFSDESRGEQEYDFILSGYYTEYIYVPQYGPPDGYFSQEFLDSVFGGEKLDMTLYMRQYDRIEGRTVEDNLYRDIRMRDISQQFLGYNTVVNEAFFSLAGGFDTVLILAVVILISVGLLIYNVLHISFQRNVREYGLLKTIGTTGKQLRGIVFWQMRRSLLYGGLIGAAAGVLFAFIVMPIFLSKMYLYRFGSASGMITFHPLFLVAAVLFAGAVTFFSSVLAVRQTLKLTPVEAVNYMEKADSGNYRKGGARKNSRHKVPLSQMAWRNIMRFKKRFFISAACLSLGLIVSLGIVMISRGTDTRNEIEHDYSDIVVDTQLHAEWYQEEYAPHVLFPDELLNQIQALPGIENSIVSRGGFSEVLTEDKALDLIRDDMNIDMYFYRTPCTVQIMSDEYLKELKAFAKEQGLYLDVDAVLDGEGVILLHDHQLSPAQIGMSKDMIGMTLGIYGNGNEKIDMHLCGYLDLQQDKLPEINYTWRSESSVYFLIGEKGFQNLQIMKQNFAIRIDAEPGSRVALGRNVEKLVNEYNSQYPPDEFGNEDYRRLDVTLKIDILQEMNDYIVSNRLVLGALCAVLLFMGIINYVDVMITGLSARKREIAVMESVGMTRKQLRKMLILEGAFYSLILTVLTGILGGGIFFLVGKVMREKVEYYVVNYPVVEFAGCSAALFLSCIVIVLVLYRKCVEESVSMRLRMYAD